MFIHICASILWTCVQYGIASRIYRCRCLLYWYWFKALVRFFSLSALVGHKDHSYADYQSAQLSVAFAQKRGSGLDYILTRLMNYLKPYVTLSSLFLKLTPTLTITCPLQLFLGSSQQKRPNEKRWMPCTIQKFCQRGHNIYSNFVKTF